MKKQRWEESEQRRAEGRRSEKRKSEKKEDAGARKASNVANTALFQCFVAPEGRKVGSLKRRVRSHVARWEMKNCTPLWREAHFQVKMPITHQVRSTFWSWDVEKVRAVVARRMFRSQKWKNCGFGPLLDVRMSFCVVGTRDAALCQKWEKMFCSILCYNRHYTTLHSTPTTSTTTSTLHYTNYITPHSTPLHSTPLH